MKVAEYPTDKECKAVVLKVCASLSEAVDWLHLLC